MANGVYFVKSTPPTTFSVPVYYLQVCLNIIDYTAKFALLQTTTNKQKLHTYNVH